METSMFYLPCPNNVDKEPPSFKGWYNPNQKWNGWYVPLFTKDVWLDIVAYYLNTSTNTTEMIEDLRPYADPEKSKTTKCISVGGNLYTFGGGSLCWSTDEEEES